MKPAAKYLGSNCTLLLDFIRSNNNDDDCDDNDCDDDD